jgi:hypothetical protein
LILVRQTDINVLAEKKNGDDKMNKREHICPYEECYLPDNNNKYWVQVVFLVISGTVLIAKKSDFTFFSILMFVAPSVMDLIGTKLRSRIYNVIRRIFVTLNVVIIVFCACGLAGFFVDGGETFYISAEAVILGGVGFNKKYILFLMLANLVSPILMITASPCKKSKVMLAAMKNKSEVG